MKNILNIIIICLIATVSANAQMATSTRVRYMNRLVALCRPTKRRSAPTSPRADIREAFAGVLKAMTILVIQMIIVPQSGTVYCR